MEETIKEIVWYKDLDWSAIWVCFSSYVALMFFLKGKLPKDPEEAKKYLKGIGNYYILSKWNIGFHFLAAFIVLSFASEVGLPVILFLLGNFVELPPEHISTAKHFLACLSGIGGGYILAMIITRLLKIKQ